MSRKLAEQYIFTPGLAGSGTIKIPGKVDLSQLLVITNKSVQENLYAIGDPTRNATVSYNAHDTTTFYSSTPGITTITLTTKNTSDMLSTDKIAVYTDAPQYQGITTRPYWFGTDAIERQRVSNPLAMIDADFEYGLQTTKWQNYSSVRNIPGIYEKPGLDLFITSITTDGSTPSLITVTCSAAHGLAVADAVVMHGLTNATGFSRAEGAFIINTVPNSTSFTYFGKGIIGTAGQTLFGASTYGRRGGFYAGSQLPVVTAVSDGINPSVITVTLSANHGMIPGSPITVITTSTGTNHNLTTGNFFCERILSPTTFQFTARVGGIVAGGLVSKAFIRSDAISIHRPFDGGVIIGPYSPAAGATAIRQTKKYMRYQSGKGVMWTSGVLFCPSLNLDQISADGTVTGSTVTVSTESSHGLQVGATVIITGVVTAGYNGIYGVSSVLSEQSFTYAAAGTLASATAVLTDLPRVVIKNWYGSTVRSGAFDDQNGVYWEYDGQELAVGKRSSTYQLSGFVTVVPQSQAVTGTGCRFTQQLRAGSNIVIRGMTYKIGSITDDNTMTINPAYRGVNTSNRVKMAVIRDIRIPQSEWNMDKCDGLGQSGYVVDPAKMQMIGIQFSWYGAGFIDWMIRGPDGNMIPCHRMKQNNVNTEAYMRTANSTIRYQVINEISVACLAENITSTQTTILLDDASRYPVNGTIICEGEIISYTGKNVNTLTGCTRGTTLTQFIAGLTRTFFGRAAISHAVGNGFTGAALISVTCSPLINHWGSSYIMDGGFDMDRGYFFNYADLGNSIPASSSRTAFFIRLAPSVSNSIAGAFGDRDLINRAQLLLEKLQVQSDQPVQIYGILNPGNIDASTLTWINVNTFALGSQPSFAQISTSVTTAATPGEQNFATLSQQNGFAEIDLSQLKELTNSAIGGYSNYPDGPDVLAVVIKNLSSTTTANTNINLFWTEAQA